MCRPWLIAGGFGGGAMGFLLRPAGLLFGLTLGHFLSPMRSLLLGTHLLLFSGSASLLLGSLHFSLLLTTHLLFSLTLGYFLSPLRSLLLGTHLLLFGGTTRLLLSALGFSLLLTACLLFCLALHRHFLRAAYRFLLGAHLLFFCGSAGGLLLLALHGGGFSQLPDAICFRSGDFFNSHAFSGSSALLLGGHLLLLLRSGSGGLLACPLSLGGGLVGGHALLLGGLHRLHRLLRCSGLHAALFRFGACCRLLSGPFFCHGSFLHCLLLALLHGGAMGLLPGSLHASSFSLGGGSGSPWLSRQLWHDCRWSSHDGRWGLHGLVFKRKPRWGGCSHHGLGMLPVLTGHSRSGLRSDHRAYRFLGRSIRHRSHADDRRSFN